MKEKNIYLSDKTILEKKDKIQITRCIRKRKWGNTRKKYKHVNNAPGVYWMEDALVLSHYYTS